MNTPGHRMSDVDSTSTQAHHAWETGLGGSTTVRHLSRTPIKLSINYLSSVSARPRPADGHELNTAAGHITTVILPAIFHTILGISGPSGAMSLQSALVEEGHEAQVGMKAASPSTLDLTDACISQEAPSAESGVLRINIIQPADEAARHMRNACCLRLDLGSLLLEYPSVPPSHPGTHTISGTQKRRDAPLILLPHQNEYVGHIALDIGRAPAILTRHCVFQGFLLAGAWPC